MATIFWVEDQYHWIDKFKPVLEASDFGDGENSNDIQTYRFAESARQAINHHPEPPDIVILDANLNGNDDAGLSISILINKKWSGVPIIYLSEHSGTGIEEKAFEQIQTQDFIAKHQQNVEQVLCWRIRALLRHRKMNADAEDSSGQISTGERLVCGELTIDLVTWNVYWHGIRLMNPTNSKRPLTPMPRKILKYLVESSPRPLSTLQMAEKLDVDKFNYDNYRQHIKILRQSFEQATSMAKLESFSEYCSRGKGIITFGDEGAYCWIK